MPVDVRGLELELEARQPEPRFFFCLGSPAVPSFLLSSAGPAPKFVLDDLFLLLGFSKEAGDSEVEARVWEASKRLEGLCFLFPIRWSDMSAIKL